MSFDILQRKIDEKGNPTVVGLDPLPDYIPPHIMEKHVAAKGETLEAAADAFFEFNCGIIDAVCDIVPAVKPQSAYYELLGPAGVAALKKTCDYARSRGMYVIVDIKRGDIGSTASAYSDAYLGAVKVGNSELRAFDVDCVTVNAYLGSDSIKPFLENAVEYDRAMFSLVRTSNPSAAELQDLESGGEKLYTIVGDFMEKLGEGTEGGLGYTRIGAVVGATWPEELTELRKRLKKTFFLVPGYGAQGGGAADVAGAFDDNGHGAIINSSRGIICAWKKTGNGGTDYAEASRAEAVKMRDALSAVIYQKG